MIVITTPTGHIGGRLLDILLNGAPALNQAAALDEELRVVVRDPAMLPDAVRARVDVVIGSHGDAEVLDRAFSGAHAVFWVVPSGRLASSLDEVYSGFTRPAAKAFVAHGIRHVVGVSALGRGTAVADRAGQVTASLAMDDLISSTGVAYRALANPSFMDNMLRQVASIRDHGVFTGTLAADRKAPAVATRDIAAVAARLLLDRSWTGTGEVPVLGPEDLSANDMARIMSDVLGRPVRYRRQTLDELRTALTSNGLGDVLVNGYLEMMSAAQDGLNDAVPRTPETASPTTFRVWCEEVLKPAVQAGA